MPAEGSPDAAADEMRTFLYIILAVLIAIMVGVAKVVEKGQAEGSGASDRILCICGSGA